ncbi:MAG: right-handed parallel beta-helix repeat-containing protein [Methanobacterium sp. ERen5]|nr:MAG: right-handed parallel beta-helix repeat-containing protein [Methanobacterium sp. ERen5]
MDGLKFINGNDGTDSTAGAIINYGNLSLKNLVFSDNKGFLAGAIMNYGNLTVINSTFKSNNCTNYAGGIANFGIATITNSQFTQNNGRALFNNGNMFVDSSNFIGNYIGCDNFGDSKNSLTITNSNFASSGIYSKSNTIYLYNSTFSSSSYINYLSMDYSNATIRGTSFGLSYGISVGTNSTLNISYSVLGYISTGINATVNANYNWWGSNKLPKLYNVNVDKWIILTFASDKTTIPSKTDANITVMFKATDGKNIYDLGNNYMPSRYVSFDTDNGNFLVSNGYIANNTFSNTYANNTEDTWIYAGVDNQKVRLIIGTGWTNYSIYVSNDGDDYYGDGSKNNPYKTIQKALTKALNGNKIYLFSGTYTGLYNTDLFINKYLTFNTFNGDVWIYRYSNLTLFDVSEFGQLNLNNINIRSNMSYNAFLINNDGVLVLNNCTLSNSTSCINDAGVTKVYDSKFYNIIGIVIDSENDLTVVRSTFTNISPISYNINENPKIIHAGGNLKVINSTFQNNSLFAIIADSYSNSTILVSGSTFSNNTGGVICNKYNFGTVENCTFSNNTGCSVSQAKIVNNCVFINNDGNGYKGPIIHNGDYNSQNAMVLSNSSFIGNKNSYADYEDYNSNGIIFNGGNLTVDHCSFLNNNASYGGAIYNAGNLNVTYSIFINNTAKYLANDVYNRMGNAYLLQNWWGSNSGPNNGELYCLLGNINAYNWVIMTLNVKGTVIDAALDKITDSNGKISVLNSTLPSRSVIFNGVEVTVSPENGDLINNHAFTNITSDSTKDFSVNATIDNQTVNLMIRNNSTLIDINNVAFYGKSNKYIIILRNVNGYLISNQTLNYTIMDQKGKSQKYSTVTNENGIAVITINNPIGVYKINVNYGGNGYYKGSQANATIQILTAITKLISFNGTFYGKSNVFYITLYDFMGRGISGQKINFKILNGNKSKIYYGVTDGNGRASLVVNFTKGKYNVKSSFAGNNWYGGSTSTSTFTISPINTTLTLLTKVLYGRGNAYLVKLRDGNGNVIRNEKIAIIISQGKLNQTFNVKTNTNGTAGIIINLYPGLYNITSKYSGNSLCKASTTKGNLTINTVKTKLIADPVISNFNNSYNVTLTDIYNRPLAGEKVDINVISPKLNAKYSLITNSKGVANLLINLDVGNYIILNTFQTNKWYNSTSTASSVFITNVTATNWFIYNYMKNAQIQHVIDNCPNSGNVIFIGGLYKNLVLKISNQVNIKTNGNVILEGNGSGVAFTLNSHCSIHGLIFKNYKTGILNRANKVTITNNTFLGNVNGIVNYGSGSGVKISVNSFSSNKDSGITNYGNNLTFKWFKMVNNRVGIINRGMNVDVLNNAVTGGQYGVMNYGKFVDINYNKISGAAMSGVCNVGLNSSINYNTLKNNVYGVYNGGMATNICHNVVNGGSRGVVNSASSSTIILNVIKSVKSYGVYNSGSKDKISNNTMIGYGGGYGVYSAQNSRSNAFLGNVISKFSYGVFEEGHSNSIKSNRLTQNKIGLYISSSTKNAQVSYNKINKNLKYGVYNKGSKTTLYKNQITNNTKYGWATVKSVKNTQNTIKWNKINTTIIK